MIIRAGIKVFQRWTGVDPASPAWEAAMPMYTGVSGDMLHFGAVLHRRIIAINVLD
jgi:hypothetical protein